MIFLINSLQSITKLVKIIKNENWEFFSKKFVFGIALGLSYVSLQNSNELLLFILNNRWSYLLHVLKYR